MNKYYNGKINNIFYLFYACFSMLFKVLILNWKRLNKRENISGIDQCDWDRLEGNIVFETFSI
jgi:hypothetical protein